MRVLFLVPLLPVVTGKNKVNSFSNQLKLNWVYKFVVTIVYHKVQNREFCKKGPECCSILYLICEGWTVILTLIFIIPKGQLISSFNWVPTKYHHNLLHVKGAKNQEKWNQIEGNRRITCWKCAFGNVPMIISFTNCSLFNLWLTWNSRAYNNLIFSIHAAMDEHLHKYCSTWASLIYKIKELNTTKIVLS